MALPVDEQKSLCSLRELAACPLKVVMPGLDGDGNIRVAAD
ncbi:MAG: hypothetical protein ACRCRW_09190 [Aeromonadaceae bacterium]